MSKFKQEMPPEGGFGEIHYKAVPTKRWISNKNLAIAATLYIAINCYHGKKLQRLRQYDEINEHDAKIALEPFLEAERDRNFLTQLWRNREMEMKIMKDVPGWEAGTFYGKPYFTTLDKDQIIPELCQSFNLFSPAIRSRNVDPTVLDVGLAEWRMG